MWAHAGGGLYFGRARDGTMRICMTNGLSPSDEKAAPSFGQVQPEAFGQLLSFAFGAERRPELLEELKRTARAAAIKLQNGSGAPDPASVADAVAEALAPFVAPPPPWA